MDVCNGTQTQNPKQTGMWPSSMEQVHDNDDDEDH